MFGSIVGSRSKPNSTCRGGDGIAMLTSAALPGAFAGGMPNSNATCGDGVAPTFVTLQSTDQRDIVRLLVPGVSSVSTDACSECVNSVYCRPKETPLCSQLSLCLSRAWLGKMIVCSIEMAQKRAFFAPNPNSKSTGTWIRRHAHHTQDIQSDHQSH
eukprot:COSAG06_NODE_4569_length_4139_cov_2.100248_2_plen_157_part_00